MNLCPDNLFVSFSFFSPLLIVINQENLNVWKLLLFETERLGRYSRTVGRIYPKLNWNFIIINVILNNNEQILV